MSASLLVIILSDKEDAQICKHEVALEKAKCVKEEWQRQWEEEAQKAEEAKRKWREAEAEKARREAEAEKAQREAEAEKAQRDVEVEEAQRNTEEEEAARKEAKKNKKAKVSVARWKQLELLSQHKVAVHIAWAEEAQRVSEAKETPSGIMGYGKGKVLEKRVCTNCLRKGVECEWDEGG